MKVILAGPAVFGFVVLVLFVVGVGVYFGYARVRRFLAARDDAAQEEDGDGTYAVPANLALDALAAGDPPSAVQVDGDLRIQGTLSIPSGLVVRGTMRLDDDATIDAPLQVVGDLILGARARATRPLLVEGALILGEDAVTPSCRVSGDVHLAAGARIDGEVQCASLFLAEAPKVSFQERIAEFVTVHRVVE